jgi:hypothetical protein
MSDFDVLKRIFNAFDPFRPLAAGDPAYVDCQEVRGDGNILVELGRTIQFDNHTTCQLYGGHRGAGKSTELLRLKKYLEDEGYKVVYFAADEEDINSEDTQYADILLACTRHLLNELRGGDQNPIWRWMQDRMKSVVELMGSTVTLDDMSIESQINQFSKITATLKTSPTTRAQIRQKIEPYTESLVEALNVFIAQAMGKALDEPCTQLVVMADSLDRIVPIYDVDSKRTNYDDIFIARSEQLKALNCHVIYTVPISLLYSDRATDMQTIYGSSGEVLPMIKVQTVDNQPYPAGVAKLKELVFRRVELAVPRYATDSELPNLFQPGTLEQLCTMSGGHVRDLMLLTQAAVKRSDRLPIPAKAVQRALSEVQLAYERTVNADQWEVLVTTHRTKEVQNDSTHRDLLFRRCILEYRDLEEDGTLRCWYDVHPLIRQLKDFQRVLNAGTAQIS